MTTFLESCGAVPFARASPLTPITTRFLVQRVGWTLSGGWEILRFHHGSVSIAKKYIVRFLDDPWPIKLVLALTKYTTASNGPMSLLVFSST